MNPADHATHLRQTADLMETAARAIEREKALESDLKKWREHLDGEVSRRLMMEQQICGLLPPPEEGDSRPQFERLLERLRLANDANLAWDDLMIRCDALKGEVVTAGNHASCRLNVLGEIHRILGSDGSPTGVNVLTGVPPEYARLPKRIEQLLADVTTWRERYDKEVAKNDELLRENETLARQVPPVPPENDPIFWNPYNGAVQDHRDGTVIQPDTDKERAKRGLPPLETESPVLIGQQWCRIPADSDLPYGFVYLYYTDAMVIRCNTYQNPDGTLTYVPVRISDLPEVSTQ